jgi:hypothetical protein
VKAYRIGGGRTGLEEIEMTEIAMKKLQKLAKQLARLIRAEADSRLTTSKKTKKKVNPQQELPTWVSACLDTRWFSEGGGFTSKLRVVLPSGNLFSIQVSFGQSGLLHKISSLRKEDTSVDWYGLKITVSCDGVVTTELDTDPNCVVEPNWFKS